MTPPAGEGNWSILLHPLFKLMAVPSILLKKTVINSGFNTAMLIFDSHLDLAWNATEWGRDLTDSVAGIRESERDLEGIARGVNTVSYHEMRRGGIGLCIATVLTRRIVDSYPPFIPYSTPEENYRKGLEQAEHYREMERLGLLTNISDVRQLLEHCNLWLESSPGEFPPIGYILGMEGAEAILNPSAVWDWKEQGLRVLGPVHYGENRYGFGTGCAEGFKPLGMELLKEMQHAGIVLDVTHLSDRGIEESLHVFEGAILSSHHNCRSLVPGERQLSDSQIRKLAARKAVIGVAMDTWMLEPGWEKGTSIPSATLETVVDHIDHICQVTGSCSHVGIGSDLDGGFGTEQCPADIDTIADISRLEDILAEREYTDDEIEAVLYRNWLGFFVRAFREG